MGFSVGEAGRFGSVKAIAKFIKTVVVLLFLFFFLGYSAGEDIPDFDR